MDYREDHRLYFDSDDHEITGIPQDVGIELKDAADPLNKINCSLGARLDGFLHLLVCDMDDYIKVVGNGDLKPLVANIRRLQTMRQAIIDIIGPELTADLMATPTR